MKSMLTPPGIERLKPSYDEPRSNCAFKFNLRRYNPAKPLAVCSEPTPTSHYKTTFIPYPLARPHH